MKNNKMLIWLGALVVAVLVVVVGVKLENRKPSEKSLKFFPTVTEKTISAVLMMDGEGTVKVRRKGDIWVVAPASEAKPQAAAGAIAKDTATPAASATSEKEYAADSASIATALEKIVGMKKEILVSENPEKQKVFEVDTAKGLYVEVWDNAGKSLGSVRIGKNGPDWSSHYVRVMGSNEVYSVGGSIKYSFFTDHKRWRDKTVMRFDRASAKKINVTKKGSTVFTLAKAADTGSTWNLAEPVKSPAKTDQVDEMLNTLSNLIAAEYEDSAYTDSVMGFADPEMVVVVTLGGDVTRRLTVGKPKPEASKYWVKAEGKDGALLVNDYDIQKLDKNVDGLKAEPAPAADAAKPAPAPTLAPAPAIK